MNHEWRSEGACNGVDPDVFFPERGVSLEPARAICSTCPVFDPCWEAGIREKFGVWGGTSERERRRIRRRLGIVLAEPEDLDGDDEHDDDNPLTHLGDIA